MSDIILDASAVIAVYKNEPGADRVKAVATEARLSSVTITEIAGWLMLQGAPLELAYEALHSFNLVVEPLHHARAIQAGLLVARTKSRGLSLADRACLALAIELGLPVMTGDRAWRDLDLGVEVKLFR